MTVLPEHQKTRREPVAGRVSAAAGTDQPSFTRRWSWVGVLASGVIAYLVVLRVMTYTENINYFPTLLLIGSITVPVATLVFAVRGGRGVPSSTSLIVFTAIVGGLVGTLAAGVLEYRSLQDLDATSMILVGIIEETAKLAVPLLIYLFGRPSDTRTGVVVGIAAGMGFAAMETMGYGFQVLLEARSIAAVDQTLLLRALLSPASHIAWTGMTVAMLWRIRASAHKSRALWAFLLTFSAAIVMHAAWDSSTSTAMHIGLAVVGYGVLMVFVHIAHRAVSGPRTTTELEVHSPE